MSDDQVPPHVTVDLSIGSASVVIKAHAPLADVADVAASLLERATKSAPPHRPVGFAGGSMVHVETPCTEPAEPYAGVPRSSGP